MANKKRFRENYKKNLGRHIFSRHDILVIEKMMREYGDAYDDRMMKGYSSAERKKLSENSRKFADCHVQVGRYHHRLPRFGWMSMEIDYSGVEWIENADSVKFLQKDYRSTRYFQVACHPGLTLTIKPFSCELYANRQYANGGELRILDSVTKKIEKHVKSVKGAIRSNVYLRGNLVYT